MSNLETIKGIIHSSELSDQEKSNLVKIFEKAEERDLLLALDLFSKDPGWMKKFSDNFEAKKVASITNDKQLWLGIIDAEINELNQ